MFKNVASQKVAMFAFDITTGAPKTGDGANITPYVSKDYGTVTVLGTTTATEMDATNAKGWYSFVLTQGETNADSLVFSAKTTTASISIIGPQVFTTPPNFSTFSVDSNGRVDVIKVAGTTQTARDLGANLDAAVSTRMATYSQPTGFLAATFPSGTVANTTNITAGTITTTTNLTNAPTSGDFTSTMKTSLNAATPTVTAGTVSDKTGYSLTSAYDPAKTASQAGDAMALTSGERNSTADALLNRDMSTGTDSGSPSVRTVRQALRFLRNKWSISGTTLTVTKEDDSTSSWTSSLTADPSASPIITSDPA